MIELIKIEALPPEDPCRFASQAFERGRLASRPGGLFEKAKTAKQQMQILAAGQAPAVFTSSNIPGGDQRNIDAIERYRGRVRSL